MTNPVRKNIAFFIFLVLIQVSIFNNIQLSGYINPYIYVVFILMLPFETSKWLLLLSSFLLGLCIDFFTHTIGVHAAACTFMAFCRPGVISYLSSGKDIEPGMKPSIHDFGFTWFLSYSIILIFLHHLLLFYLEVFRFNEILLTLTRVIISTFVTLILVIIINYFFFKTKRR
jgi:rod shape-determining protein MreD